MKKISNIHYTDAYYILENGDDFVVKLPHNEAYGRIENGKNGSFVIHFIDKVENLAFSKNKRSSLIVKGLVLPNAAVLSKSKGGFIEGLESLVYGQKISLTWSDVVYAENETRNECSKMYTEGTVFRNNQDNIVILNPETIRIHPQPIKNHPSIKPAYYVIPKAFVTSFELFKI